MIINCTDKKEKHKQLQVILCMTIRKYDTICKWHVPAPEPPKTKVDNHLVLTVITDSKLLKDSLKDKLFIRK
jgi:hypothetical protein